MIAQATPAVNFQRDSREEQGAATRRQGKKGNTLAHSARRLNCGRLASVPWVSSRLWRSSRFVFSRTPVALAERGLPEVPPKTKLQLCNIISDVHQLGDSSSPVSVLTPGLSVLLVPANKFSQECRDEF